MTFEEKCEACAELADRAATEIVRDVMHAHADGQGPEAAAFIAKHGVILERLLYACAALGIAAGHEQEAMARAGGLDVPSAVN